MVGRTVINLPIAFTDGNQDNWPTDPAFRYMADDHLYHEKLADLWMAETGEAEDGEKYVLENLPHNYRIYVKSRKNGGLVDRYIFGQDGGRFDSPNKFFIHFKWLMNQGLDSCACVNCSTEKMSSRNVEKAAKGAATDDFDHEVGYKEQLETYFKKMMITPNKEIEESWAGRGEKDIFDENHTFAELARFYRNSHTFLPRRGELVLFYTNGLQFGQFDHQQQFKIFEGGFREGLLNIAGGFPNWKAGVVSNEAPDDMGLPELSITSPQELKDGYHGYLIDLYPDPNGTDKSLSSMTYHVSLDHIRPLSMYDVMLSGLPQKEWHPTIHNALRVMATICVVDPLSFRGKRPWAIIECRGAWVGGELLVVGDAVRLDPKKDGGHVDTVLIIDGVEWHFGDVDRLKSQVTFRGKGYTTNKAHALRQTTLNKKEIAEFPGGRLPLSFGGYDWYPLCKLDGKTKRGRLVQDVYQIEAKEVLGRHYSAPATEVLTSSSNFENSDSGTVMARFWARNYRKHWCSTPKMEWLMVNDRVEALEIKVMNGNVIRKGISEEKAPSIGLGSDKSNTRDSSKGSKTETPGNLNGVPVGMTRKGWDATDGTPRPGEPRKYLHEYDIVTDRLHTIEADYQSYPELEVAKKKEKASI